MHHMRTSTFTDRLGAVSAVSLSEAFALALESSASGDDPFVRSLGKWAITNTFARLLEIGAAPCLETVRGEPVLMLDCWRIRSSQDQSRQIMINVYRTPTGFYAVDVGGGFVGAITGPDDRDYLASVCGSL